MEPSAIATYLGSQFGAQVQVRSVLRAFPGMSRETYLVYAEVGDEPSPLVIRTDPPGGGGDLVPLRVEWEVYQRLWGTPVPLAEPLWFDDRCELARGQPAMVRRMVEGSPQVAGLHEPGPDGDALRRSTAFAHAEMLATIHTLDWQGLGLSEVLEAPADPAAAFRLDFDTWRDRWHERKTAPYPVITEVLYWLQDHLPTDSPQISLTKGTNGAGKQIWRDGTIVAATDWELAQLSDGALDWGFAPEMLALHDLDETIAHYEEHAGFELSRPNLAYAIVFSAVKVMTRSSSRMWAYLDQRDRRPGLATLGLGAVKHLEHRLADVVGGDLHDAADAILRHRSRTVEGRL